MVLASATGCTHQSSSALVEATQMAAVENAERIIFPAYSDVNLSPFPTSKTAICANQESKAGIRMEVPSNPRLSLTAAGGQARTPRKSAKSPAREPSPAKVLDDIRSDTLADRCNRARQIASTIRHTERGDSCQRHDDLYREAFLRKQRLRGMQEDAEMEGKREEQRRQSQHAHNMKERRRLYQSKDRRTHLEREAELLRKRELTHRQSETFKHKREVDELRECTFYPKLIEGTRRSVSPRRSLTPRGTAASKSPRATLQATLQALAKRQQAATAAMKVLAQDEADLREILHSMQVEVYRTIRHKEILRVVTALKQPDASHCDLIKRIEATASAGSDPDLVQAIIEELVDGSGEEINLVVDRAFRPKQAAAEKELYSRRQALVRELEAVEAEVNGLQGEKLREAARECGIEFGLADHARRSLPSRPISLPLSRANGPDEAEEQTVGTPYSARVGQVDDSFSNLELPSTPPRFPWPDAPGSPRSPSLCSPCLELPSLSVHDQSASFREDFLKQEISDA